MKLAGDFFWDYVHVAYELLLLCKASSTRLLMFETRDWSCYLALLCRGYTLSASTITVILSW